MPGMRLVGFGCTLAYKVYNELAVMPHLWLGVIPGTCTPRLLQPELNEFKGTVEFFKTAR